MNVHLLTLPCLGRQRRGAGAFASDRSRDPERYEAIGRDPQRYEAMLDELEEVARLADKLGIREGQQALTEEVWPIVNMTPEKTGVRQ